MKLEKTLMKALRTPDERFDNLPSYPYLKQKKPHTMPRFPMPATRQAP
jgi:hypothetical protein